jgi:diguanylate cyclase
MERAVPGAWWLWLALIVLPASANDSLEPAVVDIERLAVTAHWRESNAAIEALGAEASALSAVQRQRLDYIRLRNQALAGDERGALDGLDRLLRQELPVELRLKIYATAISIAANVEEWTLAFKWLNEGLAHLPESGKGASGVLSAASYLHTLVGETGKARDLAMRALEDVERGGDARAICLALADIALAEDHAGNYEVSERWRRRQIDTCTLAGDGVFVASGKYGVGKMAVRQGRFIDALGWAREALADFERSGYAAGAWSARLVIAESLIASGQGLEEAEALLASTLRYYRTQDASLATAETEQLLARLAERRGDTAGALSHLKQAMAATEAAERDARQRRLAYLQVEFDTRLKEQEIALLQAERELSELQAVATQRRQWLLAAGMGGLLVTAVLLGLLLRHAFLERRRYRQQSERDGLTGLYNYQHVRRLGEEKLERARREGRPFTAIVADIDLFKEVNDRHGHAAGDEALRSLGRWIGDVFSAHGIAGRSGGDEFTMLVDTDAAGAEALLQQLRDRVEPISVFGETVRFSISAGVCQARGHATSLEHLVHDADKALYRAKQQGRDRVVCTGESAPAPPSSRGLVVVGSGIDFGRHASERCLSEIREADVVFCLVDAFALGMIQRFRPDAVNLGVHYAAGKDRRETYRAIDAAIMAEVRAGRRVCAVFYGHPGVFADVPHVVVRKARAEGFPARMEPGISAEACLYADLGIDPGRHGVQSLEATHFIVHQRPLDTRGLVLLWQVALSGDLACTRFHAEREGLQSLVDRLLQWYPPEHEVILYEAAQLPIGTFRADRLALRDLPDAHYEEYTTLVVPPLAVAAGAAAA